MNTYLLITILAYCILGLITGLFKGLFGIGGGIVITPGLIAIFKLLDVPEEYLTHMAIGTSLVYMLFTSSITSYFYFKLRFGKIKPKLVLFMAALIGGYFGSKLALKSSGEILEIILGIIELGVGFQILIFGYLRGNKPEANENSVVLGYGWLLFSILGFFCGFISPLTGVGGGVVAVPALLLLFRLPYKESVGYGAFMVIGPSLIGTIFFVIEGLKQDVINTHPVLLSVLHPSTGLISPLALIFLIPLGSVGAYLGTLIVKNSDENKMKFLLALVLIVVGSWVLIDAIL